MSFEWDRKTVEMLIDSYKKKECLWNVRNPLYHHKISRRSALQQVVSEVDVLNTGLNCNEVTKKFNTLRTQYLSEIKKIRASETSGCEANEVYKPTVWWFSRLNFLRGVLQRRRFPPNLREQRKLSQIVEVHMPDTDDECDGAGFAGSLQLITGQVVSDSSVLSPTSQSQNSSSPPQCEIEDAVATPSPKRMLKKKFKADSSVNSVPHILENIGQVLSRQAPSDEASQFGEFIASKLRRINSAALRLSAEHEIMNVIMKTEVENLNLDLQSQKQEHDYC